MDSPNTFLLQDTEAFMRGELDNVTVAGGHIVLDMVRGAYVPYGCYTSPVIPLPVFDALRLSWNVCAPPDTAVELQARVLVDGNWTAWCGFGRWSLFLPRTGAVPMLRGPLCLRGDELTLDGKAATQAQVRIYLYTKGVAVTPAVRLLAVSARPVAGMADRGRAVNAKLRLIPYAAARRAPALQEGMDLACCVAALTNRWGADLLPEELAQAMRDHAGGANLAFAAAAAAAWGFPAWTGWCDLARLRGELRAGYGVVVALRDPDASPPPAPEPDPVPEDAPAAPPALPFQTPRRYVAVRGLAGDSVLLVDPRAADGDFVAETEMPLDGFLAAWTGLALFMRQRLPLQKVPHGSEGGCPARSAVSLRAKADAPGLYELYLNGAPYPLDEAFTAAGGVLAWTGREQQPHATTGHRAFHFAAPEDGCVRLDTDPAARQRFTVFAIPPSGCMLVGDAVL